MAVKSMGVATAVMEATGSSGESAVASREKDAAEAPGDQVDLGAAGVGADRLHGLRDHVLDPVFDAEGAVGEGDGAVVDQVDPAALADQVFGQAAAAAQVEAERGRGQRRHEQYWRALGVGAAEAVDGAARPLVDQDAGHRPQVGEAVAEDLGRDVRRGGGKVRRGREHLVIVAVCNRQGKRTWRGVGHIELVVAYRAEEGF
jgi:hypothetical protein